MSLDLQNHLHNQLESIGPEAEPGYIAPYFQKVSF
jgi:hypothetical protein